jgi:hypothetical protein
VGRHIQKFEVHFDFPHSTSSPIPFILISPEMEGIRNSFPFSCAKRKELKNNRIKGSVL